jgi:hypothetical protein
MDCDEWNFFWDFSTICNLIPRISACEISLFAELRDRGNFTFARSDCSISFKRSCIRGQVDCIPLKGRGIRAGSGRSGGEC